MAAQDYYNSFATSPGNPPYPDYSSQAYHELPVQQRPPSFAPSTAPPPYSPGPYASSPQPQSRPGTQQPYYPPQGAQTLRPPGHYASSLALKPARSHSSPPTDEKHHPHHGHHRRDSSDDPSRSRSHSRHRRRHHSHASPHDDVTTQRGFDRRAHHRGNHKGVDTFLGAGGGAILGDAIFPGLGTVGGLLLGGYGGREYAKRKDRDTDGRLREPGHGGRRSRSSRPDYRY